MKVLHVSTSAKRGGAARAANRIVEAQRKYGLDSSFLVLRADEEDEVVKSVISGKQQTFRACTSPYVDSFLSKLSRSLEPSLVSPGLMSAFGVKQINDSTADIVNLHWTSGGFLSILAISKITKPVVWTLHDMWAFSGASHYESASSYTQAAQAAQGVKSRRLPSVSLDIDRIASHLKRKLWKRPMQLVTPSDWLNNRVTSSDLMATWPVQTIPYAIDLDFWRPIDSLSARQGLGLRPGAKIVLFGATGATHDRRKGFDLLVEALHKLQQRGQEFDLLIFGNNAEMSLPHISREIHSIGLVNDEATLVKAYSAADVFVLPSREDNLPNTGIESLACGTPLVTFDAGGCGEIAKHLDSGYVARAFDTSALADGIQWALRSNARELRDRARRRAIRLFSESEVAKSYRTLYESILREVP